MPDLINAGTPADTYQQNDLFTASPLRLVIRVLGGAISSIERSAQYQQQSDGNRFRKELNRARGLVAELFGALDKEQGGEVAERLEALYEYILTQLLGPSAGTNQLRFAAELLTKVKEGFDTILCDPGVSH